MQTSSISGLVPSQGQKWRARKGKHANAVVEIYRVTPNSVMIVAAGRAGKSMHGNLRDSGRVRTVPTEVFINTHEPVGASGGRDPHWLDQTTTPGRLLSAGENGKEQAVARAEQAEEAVLAPFKRCHKCGTEKPLSDFWHDKSRKDGYVDNCKPCGNEIRKNSAKKHESVVHKLELMVTPSQEYEVAYTVMVPTELTLTIRASDLTAAAMEIATRPGTIEVVSIRRVYGDV